MKCLKARKSVSQEQKDLHKIKSLININIPEGKKVYSHHFVISSRSLLGLSHQLVMRIKCNNECEILCKF